MKASGLCGSDLRAIYHEHKGSGAERYQNVIAGHEPSGQVEAVGPGAGGFEPGDRVVVYHILGCGRCGECTKGFMIGCTSHEREAYGWQRDGGHADYLLAEARTLLYLPDGLTYTDGALVACGFGTAYQGLLRAGVSGRDTVLVVGLGPVGLGAVMLAAASGAEVIGVDLIPDRLELAKSAGAAHVLTGGEDVAEEIRDLAEGRGVEVGMDCSGSAAGREAVPAGRPRVGTGRLHRRGRLRHVRAEPSAAAQTAHAARFLGLRYQRDEKTPRASGAQRSAPRVDGHPHVLALRHQTGLRGLRRRQDGQSRDPLVETYEHTRLRYACDGGHHPRAGMNPTRSGSTGEP